MNSFYTIRGTVSEPLAHKRERSLIRAWQKQKDHESRDALIKNYILFTVKISRRLYGWLGEDVTLSIAHDALLDSIDRFTLHRKTARLCNLIPFSVRMAFKKHRRDVRLVRCPVKDRRPDAELFLSLDAIIPNGRFAPTEFYEGHDIAPDLSPEVDAALLVDPEGSALDERNREEQRKMIVRAMVLMSGEERALLNKCFFAGKSLAEIGREMGVTREAIRQKRNAALDSLRTKLKHFDCFRN